MSQEIRNVSKLQAKMRTLLPSTNNTGAEVTVLAGI